MPGNPDFEKETMESKRSGLKIITHQKFSLNSYHVTHLMINKLRALQYCGLGPALKNGFFCEKIGFLSDLYDSTEICTKTLICIKLCVCMFISEEHTDVLKLIRVIHKHMVEHNGVKLF